MTKGRQIASKIVSVGEMRQVGDYEIIDVQVKELSTGQDLKVSVFCHGKDFHFNAGDSILIPAMVKEWKGKPQYSTSLNKIEPMENFPPKEAEKPNEPAKEAPKGKEAVPAEVWIEKDLRIARQNALRHAVQIIDMVKHRFETNLVASDYTNLVMIEAQTLVDFIYNGTKPDKSLKSEPEVK